MRRIGAELGAGLRFELGATKTSPGLAAAAAAMASSCAGVIVERGAGAWGHGLLLGARMNDINSIRLALGYLALRLFTAATPLRYPEAQSSCSKTPQGGDRQWLPCARFLLHAPGGIERARVGEPVAVVRRMR